MSWQRLGWLFLALLSPLVSACAGAPPPRAGSAATSSTEPVRPVAISDEEFAGYTYRVLTDAEPSGERTNILAGLVQRQLGRAERRFELGNERVGLRALLGAFLLLRQGEFRPEMVEGQARALSHGAEEVARLGQEGYAVALYSLLREELSAGPERAEVEGHLEAIAQFTRAMRGSSPLQSSGTVARGAAQRALLESTTTATSFAHTRLASWIQRALDSHVMDRPFRSNQDRDEALEAYRAMRGGSLALIALYLRHGDAASALTALDPDQLERIVAPELTEPLEQAADHSEPEAWAALYRYFQLAAESGESLLVFDPELMAGAAWGSALELYRSAPGELSGAMPLAAQLVNYGMAEVAALVLASAVGPGSPREHVGAVLAMLQNAIVAEDAAGQLDSARRTYQGADALLDLAETKAFAGQVEPSAARVRFVMASVEARHAELSNALPLLDQSVRADPTPEANLMIAAIQRQHRHVEEALGALDRIIALAQRTRDDPAALDAMIQRFEVLRDAGRAQDASQALDRALTQAVDIQRKSRPGPSQSQVERLLARVLEHYPDPPGIRRANQRAFQAASGDRRQLSMTVLDASRRALTMASLQDARTAAQWAIDASLPSDEIVYVALWLELLERKLHVASDGTVEEALSHVEESSGWPARLRAWCRGKLTDKDLEEAARDTTQRVEATFYAAMNRRASGADASAALRRVADSPAIDLMEVAIARDLLAPRVAVKLPASIAIP